MYPAAAMEAYRRKPVQSKDVLHGAPPHTAGPLDAQVRTQYPLKGAAGVHNTGNMQTPSGSLEHAKTAAQRWPKARTMSKPCIGWRQPAPRAQSNPRSAFRSHDGTGTQFTQEADLPSGPVQGNHAPVMHPPINAINTRGACNLFAHQHVRDTTAQLRARSAQHTRPHRRCVSSSSFSTMQPVLPNYVDSASRSAQKPAPMSLLSRSSSERAFSACHFSVSGGTPSRSTASVVQRPQISLWTQRRSFNSIPRDGTHVGDACDDVLSDASNLALTPDFEQVTRGRSTSVPGTTCCTTDRSGLLSPTARPDGATNDATPTREKSGPRQPEVDKEGLSGDALHSWNEEQKGGMHDGKDGRQSLHYNGHKENLNEEVATKAARSEDNGAPFVQQQHDALAQLQETRRQIEARIHKIQEVSLRAATMHDTPLRTTGVSPDAVDVQASPAPSPQPGFDWRLLSVMEGQLEDAWREVEMVREENRQLRKEREEARATHEVALSQNTQLSEQNTQLSEQNTQLSGQNKQLSEQIERQSQRIDDLTAALESLRGLVHTGFDQ